MGQALVGRLVSEQFPELAKLPIRLVRSTGTVNFVYRLGQKLYARLPRTEDWARDLEKELDWLPRLAPQLRLRVPEPVARGASTAEFPFTWAIYRWLPGRPYSPAPGGDETRTAEGLAQFVAELRRASVAGAPPGGRRPLSELDLATRQAIEDSRGLVDAGAALAAWERALLAPRWDAEPVWIHGDLLRPNLLVQRGRLSAVIDFGSAGIGDPAADVIPAWSVFGPAGRAAFLDALGVDDPIKERSRGYALHQAALIIPYYRNTNPGLVAHARRTVAEVLGDAG